MMKRTLVSCRPLEDVLVEHVEKALRHFGGNKSRTARSLAISIRTLRNYVAKYERLETWRVSRAQYQGRGCGAV